MKKQNVGQLGEDLAVKYLKNNGYEIIERNYRYGHGEIDIIAKDNEMLVFVEVKYRRSLEYGTPENSITEYKKKQIRKIAEAYLWQKEIEGVECRIDVISILHYSNSEPEITHYKNAF